MMSSFGSTAKMQCKRWLLQLGLEREFDGGGVAVELLQVVEFPLRGKKYMDDDITCIKSAEKGQVGLRQICSS